MQRTIFLIAALLLFVIEECSLCGQSIESFVKAFRDQFEEKREVFSDERLIYSPRLKNLYENGDRWWRLSPIERRDSLFSFLTPPMLANDIAFDIDSYDYYTFPLGFLYYKEDPRGNLISGPIRGQDWHYYDVIVPLINYLKNNPVQFIFSIENFCNDKHYGWYWTIEDNSLNVLVWDKEAGNVHKQEALLFINNPDNFYLFYNPLETP